MARTPVSRSAYERFLAERAPWADRRGRFNTLRASVFAVLLLPAAWLAYRALAGQLGAEATKTALHSTGYWAVWVLLAALTVTPAKALLGMPNLVVVRRQIGIGAGCYAALHLVLYAADQNWRLWTVATEIAVRFYLTIGFIAFLGCSC